MQQQSSVSIARQILRDTCAEFGMDPKYVVSSSRVVAVVGVRYIAIRRIYFANRSWSLPRVGAFFLRDHTTVLHALRQTDDRLRQMAATPFKEATEARRLAVHEEKAQRSSEAGHEPPKWKRSLSKYRPLVSPHVEYERRLAQLRHKMAMANRSVSQ